MSNVLCINKLCNSGMMIYMNKQMERLYKAAKELKHATGQTEVARLLNEAPQTLNNWESRGISQGGMVKAERFIGCYAAWLMDGIGPMSTDTAPSAWPLYDAAEPETRAAIDVLLLPLDARKRFEENVRLAIGVLEKSAGDILRQAGKGKRVARNQNSG